MAPPTWATDEQTEYLESRIDEYLDHQKEGTLVSFWTLLYEPWFQRWPLRDMNLDTRLFSDAEKSEHAGQLLKWKNVSQFLGNRLTLDAKLYLSALEALVS